VVLPQSNVEQITETSIELIGVRGVKSALDRILT